MIPASRRGNGFSSPSSRTSGGTSSRTSSSASSPSRIVDPNSMGYMGWLADGVSRINRSYRPQTSTNLWDSKEREFFAFCDSIFATDQYKYLLTDEKVYRFMFYNTFRSKKKTGGRRKRGTAAAAPFILNDYEEVMSEYSAFFLTPVEGQDIPEPANPLGESAFAQYRASLQHIYQSQVDNKSNAHHWDQVWTGPCKKLQGLVKQRRKAVRKANYEEKQDAEFAPYAAVERYGEIENELWKMGEANMRQSAAYLKYRYNFLHTTSGILRYESLYKAELSDFLCLTMKKENDPHPILLMITQIGFGTFLLVNVTYSIC